MSKLSSNDHSNLVRTLKPIKEDYDRLARCYNSYKDPESWPEGFGGTRIFTGEFLEKQMKDSEMSHFFVAMAPNDPNKIVGTCFVGETWNIKNGYYVLLLGVDPSYQGQRLGKALLLEATRFAASKKAKLLSLHTWAGNLKAMPLYKRQGYKWRPNTAVLMENYIPQILRNEFFNDFFSSLEQTWYEAFKPKITQVPDKEKEGKMLLYEYLFHESPSKSLKVWIDRTIGSISGFHLIDKNVDLLIKASTPNSKAYIGFETFTTTLFIKNNSDHEIKITFGYKSTSKIELHEERKGKTILTVPPNLTSEFDVLGRFLEDTDQLDTKIHYDTLTEEGIIFNIGINNINFDLTVGKIPVTAIKASLSPIEYYTIPSHTFDLPISLESFMDNPPINVTVLVKEGKHIQFTGKNEITVHLSKYDTITSFRVKVPSIPTTVDYFTVKISADDGRVLSTQKLPLPIFSNSKTVTYERDQQVFLENKHICLSFYKKPQPNSNEVNIYDKTRKLKVTGLYIILGYPFDEEGSEFSKIQLTHLVEENEQGLLLSSTALSEKKPGIRVIRKILIPHDKAEFQVLWEVENTSQDSKPNLGIQNHSYWWPDQSPLITRIIPHREGIKELDIFAFPIDLGKDPKDLSEGWHASVYEAGSVGVLFDPSEIQELTIGRIHPDFYFKVPELTPDEKYISSPIIYVFEDSWQAIRKVWLEKYHPSPSYDLEISKKAASHKKIGLKSSSGKTVAYGIIHNQKDKFLASIDAFRETVFKGELNLKIPGLIDTPQQMILPETKGREWNEEIKVLKVPEEKIFVGQLTFDSLTRIYNYPVTLVLFDNTKEVFTIRNEERAFSEVDNGIIKFRASEKYRGHVFSLSLYDEPNILHNGNVQYPEIAPYLWFNEFYGGIGPIIRPVGSWDMVDYNKLKFEPSTVTRGKWNGVSFKSDIITYSSKIKGLQINTEYLTLPDSPLLLVQIHVTNHSEVVRDYFLQVAGNLETSKSSNDYYYIDDSKSRTGYLTYRMQDWESTVYLEKELYTRWTAYKKAGSRYFVASILPNTHLGEYMYPYSPNLKIISLSMSANRMKINSKETSTFRILYFFTDRLDSVPPLVNSNVLDLLE